MSGLHDKIRLLYLDDEEVNLFIFDELFKNQFNVTTTASVEEALGIIREPKNGIQMVITDLKMHPINGITFIIRARDEGFQLPICVLSAFPKTSEIDNALSRGLISAFFNKPLDPDMIQKEAIKLVGQMKN